MITLGGDAVSHEEQRVHTPVLVRAVVRAFEPVVRGASIRWIVDGTLGAGGHARALLEAFESVHVLGVDQDPDALAVAQADLGGFGSRVRVRRGRLSQLDAILAGECIDDAAGMLLDLGTCSMHLDRPERGFSFQADGPLDMRMDPSRDRCAADIVNSWDEDDLADLFYYEGGERASHRVARAVVQARTRAPFLRTLALADAIAHSLGGRAGKKTHPATRCFQALRRAVNEEGEELRAGLDVAERCLPLGARLAVITFHSGEDGCVKRFLAEGARAGRWRPVMRRPVEPERGELAANPRARSARLRVAERSGPEETR
jgi:16S rRNA (cytosine1402-N4)-methyltransferase